MSTINLNQSVIKTPETTTTTVELRNITDNINTKTVIAHTVEFGRIVLWEGSAYDSIGDWTQEQAEDRIVEILTA